MKKKPMVEKHFLIPKHTICGDKEREQVYEKYSATAAEMPKILLSDAAISPLGAKVGDLIKIERSDPLMGKTYFYRVVANE